MNKSVFSLTLALLLGWFQTPVSQASEAAAEAYLEQATRLLNSGQLLKATEMLEGAKGDLGDRLYGDKAYAAAIYTNLGECYRRLAKQPNVGKALLSRSIDAFETALTIKENAFGTHSVEVAKALENLGTAYAETAVALKSTGNYGGTDYLLKAEAVFRKALSIRQENEGADSCSLFYDQLKLGDILIEENKKESERFYNCALATVTKCHGAKDALSGKVHQQLAQLLYGMNRLNEAISHYDKAVAIFSAQGQAMKKNTEEVKRDLRPLVVDQFASCYENYQKQLDGKGTAGPELIPAIKQLIAGCNRLGLSEYAGWLRDLEVQLHHRRLPKVSRSKV